jgi:hypothetical protein
MRDSWFSRSLFYPAVLSSFVAGNAIDLVGTYVYQPHFEHEANHLYVLLQPYGLRLTWPMVITGKVIVCLACAGGLRLFLIRRRRYYPEQSATFREFLTTFIFGRPLGWIESCFKLPRSLEPSFVAVAAVWSFGGPYFAYLGYGNLASHYGWWQLGGFWAGRFWVDWSTIIWLVIAIAIICWQLWRDFQQFTTETQRRGERMMG